MQLVVLGGGFRAWRPSLSAPPPGRARVPAHLTALPKFEVCWIDSARVGFTTSSGLLVRHPSGYLLIDAGDSLTPRNDFAGASLSSRAFIDSVPGFFKPAEPMPWLDAASHSNSSRSPTSCFQSRWMSLEMARW